MPGSSPYAPYFGKKFEYAVYNKKCSVVITDSLDVYALYWHFFSLWDSAPGDCGAESKDFSFKAAQMTAVRSVLAPAKRERACK